MPLISDKNAAQYIIRRVYAKIAANAVIQAPALTKSVLEEHKDYTY